MDKRQRNYSLFIEPADRTQLPINIKPPFTVEFDINRAYLSSASNASIRVYNLSEKNRNNIRKDQMALDQFREIKFIAGYGDSIVEILKGNVTQAWSVREGNNFITQIEAFDAGFAIVNATTSSQYPAGTANKTIVADMIESLKNSGVSIGSIGDIPGMTSRRISYSGNTMEILRELTGGTIFIDNGTAHVLNDNEVTSDPIFIINKDSGLLDTPLLEEFRVRVNIVFEPKIRVGQRILLESLTAKSFNTSQNIPGTSNSKTALYKVVAVHHSGIISEAVGGAATTQLTLVSGDFIPIARFG